LGLRVAHFVQRYPPALGGAEAYFARLSRHLAAAGDAVRVYTTNAVSLEAFWSPAGRVVSPGRAWEDGVDVRRYPVRHWPGRRFLLKALSLFPWPRLQALTLPCNPVTPSLRADAGRHGGVDLVHATAFPYAWPILCGLRLARRCGVPFLLTPFLHLGDPRDAADRTRRAYLAPAFRWLLHQADRVFVQTNLERQAVLDLGLPSDRVVLQGLGVDPTECAGGDRWRAESRWQLPPAAVRIGHLANLSAEKGTGDLLRAAARLWARGAPCDVLLAGPAMPNFTQFWRSFPAAWKAHVTQVGILADDEKPDFFAACDVFALPSRSDSFGLVLLEAWANALPCVGYRAGGVAEVIRHGQDGMLVDCGDVDGLAAALGRLVEDDNLRRRFGRQGHQRVIKEHQWPAKLELVRRVYDDVTGR
jgi:glycosyltransferase involved in cell wall biosynthesis